MQFLTSSVHTEQSVMGREYLGPEQPIQGKREKAKRAERPQDPVQNGRTPKGGTKGTPGWSLSQKLGLAQPLHSSLLLPQPARNDGCGRFTSF